MPLLSSCVGGKRNGRVVESKVFVVFRVLLLYNFGMSLFERVSGPIWVTLDHSILVFSEHGILLI